MIDAAGHQSRIVELGPDERLLGIGLEPRTDGVDEFLVRSVEDRIPDGEPGTLVVRVRAER